MISRALIVDGSGTILRTVLAPPDQLAIQAQPGEVALGIVGDTGEVIRDGELTVEDGVISLRPDAPEESVAPDLVLEPIV